jgi:hypothetical protein
LYLSKKRKGESMPSKKKEVPVIETNEEKKCKNNGMPCSVVYGLGFIGAAVYFIQHAPTFWMGVLGFLKALVWPALLIYKLLEFLKM